MGSQASQASLNDTIFVDDGLAANTSQSLAQEASQFNQSIDPALFAFPNTLSRATSQTPDIFDTPNTATQGKSKRYTLNWTLEMHTTLLESLVEQCRAGKRADSGFKKEAWIAVLIAVQVVYSGPIRIQESQAKTRIDWCKGLWKEWCSLEENSGFGWDEPTQLFTAEDSVWKAYLAVSNKYTSL
jgi:hypothetical protein